jgi:predicted neutral ceramidase superfamily lipid hydrolase
VARSQLAENSVAQLQRNEINMSRWASATKNAVLWIREIFVRFRIIVFSSLADKMPTKISFFKSFLLTTFEGTRTFTSFFRNKKSKRSHKIVEIKVFFFAC